MAPAEIAVWVLAYRARPSLARALDSVARSALPASRYQVLVLSDSPAPAGTILPGTGSSWTTRPPGPLGGWLAGALERDGPGLIALLDDDDAFAPEKLGRVLEAFGAEARLGFLHHGSRPVALDAEPGRARARSPVRRLRGPTAWTVTDPEKSAENLAALWERGAGFNHSSVAVRRELLASVAPELRRLEGGVTPLLFYGAAVSGLSLRDDAAELTEYGLHRGSESPEGTRRPLEYWSRFARLAGRRRRDAEVVIDLVERRRPEISTGPLIDARNRYRLFEELGARPVGRRPLGCAWSALARGEGLRHPGFLAVSSGLAALRFVAPPLSARLLDSGPPPPDHSP